MIGSFLSEFVPIALILDKSVGIVLKLQEIKHGLQFANFSTRVIASYVLNISH